ncbi:hypothetical protein GOODEAATRI_030114 [Goodea atripinnis]|uniref:Uncharacterized protein n=1 Tax=Goodea atripinnis TaxID=208336 RepID=A0ABV0PTB6_9TELE
MINGLNLLSSLSSPQRPRSAFHYKQSSTHSSTPSVVSYIVTTAALGQTDRSEAAIQLAPPGPLVTISRQGGWSVLPKDTMTETDRAVEPATDRLQDKPLTPEPQPAQCSCFSC